MIDKAEQRRRAAEMSKDLAAQGLEAPKLTYPVAPKPSKVLQQIVKKVHGIKYDCAGKELNVGDKVATSIDGIVSVLRIGTISAFTKDRVQIEIPMPIPPQNRGQLQTYKTVLKYPQSIAKV